MGSTVQEFRDEAVEILRRDYPGIKRGVCRLEVFMRRKSRKAVYELRDFLDHLALLYREDISVDEAEKHINECRTHLRRCVIEPLEYMAEKRFVRLDLYARLFAPMSCIMRNNPFSKPEFFQKMQEAKKLIAEGRIAKTEGHACNLMDQAFGIVTDLLSQIHPVGYLMQGLLWAIAIYLAGFLTVFACCK